MKTTPSTYFGLLAEFGATHVPVTEIGVKYFNLSEAEAKRKAASNDYPFPVFRAGGNKSTWMADITVFGEYLDAVKEKAKADYRASK